MKPRPWIRVVSAILSALMLFTGGGCAATGTADKGIQAQLDAMKVHMLGNANYHTQQRSAPALVVKGPIKIEKLEMGEGSSIEFSTPVTPLDAVTYSPQGGSFSRVMDTIKDIAPWFFGWMVLDSVKGSGNSTKILTSGSAAGTPTAPILPAPAL